MRLLFVYNGLLGPLVRSEGVSLIDDLITRGTSHPGQTNYLILLQDLKDKFGYDITVVVDKYKEGEYYFKIAGVDQLKTYDLGSAFDAVLIYKVGGVAFVRAHELWGSLKSIGIRASWHDAMRLWDAAPTGFFTSILWGTPEIADLSRDMFPGVTQGCSPHGVNFINKPVIESVVPKGLYIGRLPEPYLRDVLAAAEVSPVDAYALWLPKTSHSGKDDIWNFRPGHYAPGDVEEAQKRLPPQVTLHAAVNIGAMANTLSSYSFGICPATTTYRAQVQSASKFYDYLGLGVPVLLADNTPEAKVLTSAPVWLGALYHGNDPLRIRRAIGEIMAKLSQDGLLVKRNIMEYAHKEHTYFERTRLFHALLS